MKSRRKPKLALMIFLLFPNLLLFIKLLCVYLPKDFFFFLSHLTVYYGFISLEMGAAGSLINGLKSCFCQNQTKKQNPNTHKTFCFHISKTSTISLWASLKNAPISLSVSAKGILYPVVSRADVHSWVMARTQPASMREGDRDSPRKAEQILTSKCTWQINGANQTRHKKLGPAHRDLSCFYTAVFFLDAF